MIVNGSAAYLCRYDDTGASLGLFLGRPAGSPARQLLTTSECDGTSAQNPTIQSNRYDIKMKNSSFLCWITTRKDDSQTVVLACIYFNKQDDDKTIKTCSKPKGPSLNKTQRQLGCFNFSLFKNEKQNHM